MMMLLVDGLLVTMPTSGAATGIPAGGIFPDKYIFCGFINTYPLAVITPAYLAVITIFNTEQEGIKQ